jgi:hypothetical protein
MVPHNTFFFIPNNSNLETLCRIRISYQNVRSQRIFKNLKKNPSWQPSLPYFSSAFSFTRQSEMLIKTYLMHVHGLLSDR